MTDEPETTEEETKEEPTEPSFDAVDLMLEGNLKEQINYSIVKALAEALDEKAQILIQAEQGFEPQDGESFAEAPMSRAPCGPPINWGLGIVGAGPVA